MKNNNKVNKTRHEIIHENFHRQLMKRNIKQSDYAKDVGVNKSTVSKWITNNGSTMTPEDIHNAAVYLNIELEDLFFTKKERGQKRLIIEEDYEIISALKSTKSYIEAAKLLNVNRITLSKFVKTNKKLIDYIK